jgi:hypothetical protein
VNADEPDQEPTVHQVPEGGEIVSPPRRPMARWKKITIVAVAVPVLGLSIMFWVALAEVMSNPAAFRTHAPAPTSTTEAPTTTTTTPPTTTASSSSAPPTTTTTTTTTTTSAAPVASAQDRAAAAAILTASDQHYRDMFHQGQSIIGHTQYADAFAGLAAMDDPNSAAARFRDYRQNPGPERDLSCDDAFSQADAHFTAATEPQAISTWRDDLTPMTFDLIKWVSAVPDYQIRTKTQADVDALAAKVEQDLAKLDADAGAVGKG